MPTSRLGEEAGTHRVDGGVRSAVVSRPTTLPIDDYIVLHGVVLGLSCRTLVLCHCLRQRCATLLHCWVGQTVARCAACSTREESPGSRGRDAG